MALAMKIVSGGQSGVDQAALDVAILFHNLLWRMVAKGRLGGEFPLRPWAPEQISKNGRGRDERSFGANTTERMRQRRDYRSCSVDRPNTAAWNEIDH